MRTKWLRLAAPLAALSLALAACGGDDGGDGGDNGSEDAGEFEEGTTMAELQEAGSITVGTKFDQPLFGQANLEGEPEGFDVEMAKLVAQALYGEGGEENIEFVEAVSANREEVIENGDVDLVAATYTMNEERDERVDFAGPYYVAGGEIMVPEGNPEGIESVDDLNGLSVCTATGSTYVDSIAENAPDADLSTLFDTYTECRDAMLDGRVDAVSTDNVILAGLVSQSTEELELVGEQFTEEPYGLGHEEGDTEFCEFLNGVIEDSYESGEWERIYTETIGTVIEEVPEPPEVESCG